MIAERRCAREKARRIGAAGPLFAALFLVPLAGGCAKSSFTGWAQTSTLISPSERPPALAALWPAPEERDDEMQ